MANDFVVHAPVQEAGYAAGFEPDHADAQVRRTSEFVMISGPSLKSCAAL